MSVTITPTPPWPDSNIETMGRDVSGILDTFADGREVTGRQCLAEALARRLMTTQGTLVDDPDYGVDLRDYINFDVTPRELGEIAAIVELQCERDQRVADAAATVTFVASVLIIQVIITDAIGPFSLTLSVSNVNVTVLQVTQ